MRCIICWLMLTVLPAFLAGCAERHPVERIDREIGVVLEDTPYYPQRENHCGPAALAMLLGGGGVDVHPDELAPHTYIPGRQGSLQIELAAACRLHGRIPYILDSHISSIVDEISAGRPVLVMQNIGLRILPVYHYAVVIGVLAGDRLVLHSAGERGMIMDMDRFLAIWERAGSWAMVALSPGELPASPDRERYLESVAAFEGSGHVSQAAPAYQAAVTMWPADQTALLGLANNNLGRKKYAEAETQYRNILRLNPTHIAALNNLAETYAGRGCYADALAAVNQAVDAPGFASSPFRKAVLATETELRQALTEAGSVKKLTAD